MNRRLRLPRAWLLAAGFVGLGAWHLPVADACTCSPETRASWPYEGATDVPLVPSIVVQRTSYPGSPAPAYLEGGGGTTIPLELRNTLEEPYACVARVEFLRPADALAPFTTYTVRFDVSQVPAEAFPDESYAPSSFTTGGEGAEDQAPSEISIDLFRITNQARCKASEKCQDLAEASAGSDILSGSPTWVRLSNGGESVVGPLGTGALSSDPDGLVPHEEFVHVQLPLAAQDDCVLYERINARGEVIAEREICEYSKCVSAAATFGELGCGEGYPQLGPELWESVSDDSCSAPGRATQDPATREWMVEPSECSVLAPGAASQVPWAWWALVPLMVRRQLRSRRARSC